MIEDYLLNYGVLGLWTLTLLVERYKTHKDWKSIIRSNTAAMAEVKQAIAKCKRR